MKKIHSGYIIGVVIVVLASLLLTTSVFAQSDRDGDGVPDNTDSCSTQGNEGGLGVDDSGCPYYDADWDGVYDRDDACPWQADEYGYGIGADGCPLSSAPTEDSTPESPPESTPDTQAQATDEHSTSVDNTPEPGDNYQPSANSTEEVISTEEATPDYPARDEWRDADWDGFSDTEDTCPWRGNEGGLGVDETGCPYYDADWDGVYDRDDACPWRADEYGYGIAEDGCPLNSADDDPVVDGIDYSLLISLTNTALSDWLSASDETLGEGTREELVLALESAFQQLADLDISIETRNTLANTIIYDDWTISELELLLENYIPRLIEPGYPITDIDNIVDTVGRNQEYDVDVPEYSYVLDDLERMISEVEAVFYGTHSESNTIVPLYQINMIDTVPHLFPPNPQERPVIILTHGWSVDGVEDSAVIRDGEAIIQDDYRHTADWFAEQYAGVPEDQLPILVGVNWDADYVDVEPEDVELTWQDWLQDFSSAFQIWIRNTIEPWLEGEPTIEFTDVIGYSEIEDRSRDTGEELGHWIENYQGIHNDVSLSIISHSMGNHVALQAIETADLSIDNYIIIQAPVGAYDDETGLIDERYDDVLTDEVGEVFVTYSFYDLAMYLYQRRPPAPPYVIPLGALGERGLWENFRRALPPSISVIYEGFDMVTNFETFWNADEDIMDAHQTINLYQAWESVQNFVIDIFSDIFTP